MVHALSIITYYDVLAGACCRIGGLDSSKKQELYREYSRKKMQYSILADELLQIKKIAKIRIVLNTDLDHKCGYKLLDTIRTSADGCLIAMAAIALIDQNLEIKHNISASLEGCPIVNETNKIIGVSAHFKQFDTLNPKTEKQWGAILPMLKCSWKKRSCRSINTASADPFSILKHYLWIPPDSKFIIHNLYYSGKYVEKMDFTVSTSPITCKPSFRLKIQEQDKSFRIEYNEDAQKQEDIQLNAIINRIIAENVDFTIFPELLGTNSCANTIGEIFQKNCYGDNPKLTFLPTREYCSKVGTDTFVNELVVLDEDGNKILRYNKQHPFEYDKKTTDESGNTIIEQYFEPIRADHEIYIIHFPEIGRIGFLICSDIFDTELKEFLFNQLKISVLFHPAFSGGTDQLERAYGTAMESSIDIILCNTCAAFVENETIEDEIDNHVIPSQIEENKCKYFSYGHRITKSVSSSSTCNTTNCKGCFYLFKIPSKYDFSLENPIPIKILDLK